LYVVPHGGNFVLVRLPHPFRHALTRRVRRHVELLDELAVRREDLDAILPALTDVDEAVLRDLDEVQIGDEVLLLRRRTAVHV
jgi:hypothetical protein